MNDFGALILTPIELAFLGASAAAGEGAAVGLLEQLGAPRALVEDTSYQAGGLQVLAVRGLARVGSSEVELEPLAAEVAAALMRPLKIAVILAKLDESVSGARIIDSDSSRIVVSPEPPGCWRVASLDRSVPLPAVLIDTVGHLIADAGGTLSVSLVDGDDPTDERTVVVTQEMTTGEVRQAITALFEAGP